MTSFSNLDRLTPITLENADVISFVSFDYDAEGNPFGLCKAKKLVYITTSGGCIIDDAYGFGYIRALCENFYGIPEVLYYKAEGLDLPGTDIEGTLQAVMRQMDAAGQ